MPIGIVAYALTLLWDNLCRNSCIWLLFHTVCTQSKMGCVLGLRSRRTKKHVHESLKDKCFMCSSLYVQLMREYNVNFWKYLIVSVNQGLKASYRLKINRRSGIQNSLSTNRAKLLDFLVSSLGKLK